MKSSKSLGKAKPSMVSSIVLDNKKKTTLLPADKRMTKILVHRYFCSFYFILKKQKKMPKNLAEEKNIAEADLNDEELDELNEAVMIFFIMILVIICKYFKEFKSKQTK